MRILVAEDDCITRRLLEARLTQWGYEIVSCADGSQAWEILNREDAPHLVVLDWMMPGMDGVALCREIRKMGKQPYTYVILLTAKSRKEDVIEGLEAGADDYIVKPFDAHELDVRVRAGSRIVQLQQDLVSALSASEYQASHDPLTGLWNRRAVMDVLRRELERSLRENTSVGIIIADLDHFKRINDTYGHLAGDAVLREVAARMVSHVRSYDVVGRYGGEEFLLVSPGCDQHCAQDMAERLRQSLSERPLVTPEGVFSVTMSLGIASVQGKAKLDMDAVVRGVDQALYRAKQLGRNLVQVWQASESDPRHMGNHEASGAIPEKWVQ